MARAQRSMAAPTVSAAGTLLPTVWDNRGMPSRSKLTLIVFIIVAAAGLGTALFWRTLNPAVELATGTVLNPSRPVADFSLIDNRGRGFGPKNLQGHWSLMFFGYTNCPDFCPTTLSMLAAMQNKLRADHAVLPQVIFVSVDAKRDTPEQLAKYVPYFDPDFIGLTAADQAGVEAFAKAWGVAVMIQPAKDGNYTVDHSGAIFVLDPVGRLAAVLTGPFTEDAVRHDFQRLVSGHA
jgi:protein SCO1